MLILAIALGRGKSLRVPKGEGPKLALIGLLFMSGNNMLLTWGETMVPSGFASLIVSTLPIMVALLEWGLPGGEPLIAFQQNTGDAASLLALQPGQPVLAEWDASANRLVRDE